MQPPEEIRDEGLAVPPGVVSRRELLEALVAAAGLAVLGCRPDARPTHAGTPPGAPSLESIDRLREILRASPDHLVARARELIARRDLDAIVAFVRDRIAVLPAPTPTGDPLTAARWGAEATLRGGAGTLRERAELLASLLTAAGARATVAAIDRPAAIDRAALAAVPAARFAPDAADLEALWQQATKGLAPWPGKGEDALDAVADRISRHILDALPASAREAAPWGDDLPRSIPVVQVESSGRTRWAIALGKVGFQDSPPAGLTTSLNTVDIPAVELSVAVALAPPRGAVTDGSALHEVARGRWSAAEVAGRHVELTFVPPVPPAELVGRSPDDFPIRLPVLRLVTAEGGDPDPARNGETLAMVTRSGGLYTTDDGSQTLTGPFGLVPAADSAARQRLAGSVATIKATADASTFPAVDVAVVALDQAGHRVDGLGAADFTVEEDGKAVAFDLVANGAPAAVRLLVLYDASGSVTESWVAPAAKARFEASLARALTAAAERAPFSVQVIGLGGRAGPNGWAPPTEAGLRSAMAGITSTSDVWDSLGRALPASGASAAIMISDNQSTLEDPALVPAFRRAFAAAGVPVLAVPIGKPDEAATAFIVETSHGARLSPTAPDAAERIRAFAEAQVTRAATTSYRLRLRAAEAGPSERTVAVALRGRKSVGASARYRVPLPEARGVASGVGGVYLTITVGGRREIRRLGGVPLDGRGGYLGTIDAAAIADATGVLDRVTAVAFEPGSPAASVLLDDAVTAAMSAKAAAASVPATLDGADRAGLMNAVARAGRYPAMLPALLQPGALPGAPPEGLRVVVFALGAAKDRIVITTDIPPGLNRSLPVGATRRDAFAAALRGSLALSLREAGAMDTSAAARLGERPLQVVAPAGSLPEKGPWSAEQRAALAPLLLQYYDWYRLVPTTGTGTAFWVVDPATGTTVAVGEMGRGGAAKNCVIDQPMQLDIPTAMYWLGVAGAAISIYCASIEKKKSVPQVIGCIGAQGAGTASAAYALFTAIAWSDRAVILFVFAISNLMGGLPDWIEQGAENGTTSPEDASAKVVLAVLALLIGVLGNLKCE